MYICKPQANVGNYVALAMIPWRKSWEEERELLVINSYEVFNELERFSWWMIYPLPPLLLSSKCYLVFLQLVPQLEALFTFAFVFNKSLTFPYLLFNLSLFALSWKLCPLLLFIESKKMKRICPRQNESDSLLCFLSSDETNVTEIIESINWFSGVGYPFSFCHPWQCRHIKVSCLLLTAFFCRINQYMK